jgi:hypothetical protein
MIERNDTLAVTLAVTTALAAVVLAVIVALVPPRPTRASALEGPAGCREWTDGCVTCARQASGPACSTPGIACTRGPVTCMRR